MPNPARFPEGARQGIRTCSIAWRDRRTSLPRGSPGLVHETGPCVSLARSFGRRRAPANPAVTGRRLPQEIAFHLAIMLTTKPGPGIAPRPGLLHVIHR